MYVYIYIDIDIDIDILYRRGATREAACQTDDLQIDWGRIAARGSGISAGTHFTHFTGTTVQILARRKAVLCVYIMCICVYIRIIAALRSGISVY
jgi:hypothetical protein